MKIIVEYYRITFCLISCCLMAAMLGGCRQDVKYFLYYPHSLLGAVQPSADWREFSIAPLKLEEKEYLVVAFNQDGRTLCQNDLSAFHLCSPAALAEYNRLLEEYRAILIDNTQENHEKLKILNDRRTKTVENEPLPDCKSSC